MVRKREAVVGAEQKQVELRQKMQQEIGALKVLISEFREDAQESAELIAQMRTILDAVEEAVYGGPIGSGRGWAWHKMPGLIQALRKRRRWQKITAATFFVNLAQTVLGPADKGPGGKTLVMAYQLGNGHGPEALAAGFTYWMRLDQLNADEEKQ